MSSASNFQVIRPGQARVVQPLRFQRAMEPLGSIDIRYLRYALMPYSLRYQRTGQFPRSSRGSRYAGVSHRRITKCCRSRPIPRWVKSVSVELVAGVGGGDVIGLFFAGGSK